MTKCLIALLITVCPVASFAATAPRTPEGVWTGALEAGRSKIVAQAPKSTLIHMTVDRSSLSPFRVGVPAPLSFLLLLTPFGRHSGTSAS